MKLTVATSAEQEIAQTIELSGCKVFRNSVSKLFKHMIHLQVNMRKRMQRMGLSREDNDGTAGGNGGGDTSSSNGGESSPRVRHAARQELMIRH